MDFGKRKIKQLLLATLSILVVLAFVLVGATPALATGKTNDDASDSGSFDQLDSESSIVPEDTVQQDEQTRAVQVLAQSGEATLGSISGYVWLDADENGETGAQEAVVANIKVSLFAGDNKAAPVATTHTSADGSYMFAALQPGDYYVGLGAQTIDDKEYLIPMKMIQPGDGNRFDVDWESDPIFSYTEKIEMAEGNVVTGVNAGLRAGRKVTPLSGTYHVTDSTAGTTVGMYGTLADAVAACTTSGNKYIVEVRANDTDMGASYVTIDPSIDITLTSGSGAAYTITQQNGVRHFEVQGSLTLNNIILQGIGTSDNGGVSVKSGGLLTMQAQATITGCTAYLGGAVSLDGGTFIMDGGSLTSNQAVAGGGIHAQGSNVAIEIIDGIISDNTVTAAGGGIEMNSSTGVFTMAGGKISDNEVTGGSGGGIVVNSATFSLIAGTISGNTASTNGGGVSAVSATFTMTGGNVTGNDATTGDGGGIHVSSATNFTFDDGTISGNMAKYSGGGVLVHNSTFVMTDGTIGNNSSNGGGGIYLTQNSAFTMSGGNITGNDAVAGGGIYAIDGGSIELYDGATISGNEATDAGGGIEVNSSTSVFKMHGGTISNNEVAGGNGGGVLITDALSVAIEGGTISGNTADRLGGGVYIGGSAPFSMKKVNITGNKAAAGGGIYFANGNTVDIYSGAVSNNVASVAGGGVEMNSSTGVFNMRGGVISGNKVTGGNGGGVLISAAASVNVMAGTINDNTASGSGGGIYIGGNTAFSVQGGEITDNKSATNGGGVYVVATATLTMSDGEITGNTATLEGGGVFTEDYSYANPAVTSKYSNLTIASNVNISGNIAPVETMPINASAFSSFDGTLLTNSQINYRYKNVLTYAPNGGTGTVTTETYITTPQTVGIKTPGAVSFAATAGNEFKYWSDNPGGVPAGGLRYEGDGTGAIYLNQSKTLYAVWGQVTQGAISGYVFEDKNNNGAYNTGEGLAGRTVRLYKEVGGAYADTTLVATTNADGMYEFEVDMNENYKVLFDTTDGTMELIAKGASPTGSNVNSDGFSDVIEIGDTAATKSKTANAGYRGASTGGDAGNAGTGGHPQTGDATNLAMWVALTAVSASTLVVLLFVRRRMKVRKR